MAYVRTCVAPHLIEAGAGLRVLDQVDEATTNMMRLDIPLQRFGGADDVANAVLFLSTSNSSYVSGQTIVTDGT